MKRYFITATGTDIGKTLVTAALCRQFAAKGMRVKALKPVASGFNEASAEQSDAAQLLAAQGLTLKDIGDICPWRFATPQSPDIAAKLENRRLRFEEVLRFCNAYHRADMLLVEGIGGVMTPLTEKHTVLDLIDELDMPVILVAGTYVGTLSHTLTALAALESRALCPHRIMLSESEHSATSPTATAESLRKQLMRKIPISIIPRLDLTAEIWKNIPDLTEGLA